MKPVYHNGLSGFIFIGSPPSNFTVFTSCIDNLIFYID